MIKLIMFLLPFLKEMVFGKKNEPSENRSEHTKKKMVIFMFLLGSLSVNYIAIQKLYVVSAAHIKVMKENKRLVDIESLYSIEKYKSQTMEDAFWFCIDKRAK